MITISKIPNWSRRDTLNTDYAGWQHDKQRDSVRVLYESGKGLPDTYFETRGQKPGYYVIHNHPPERGKPAINTDIIASGFSSQSKAEKAAVNWMRRNPSP